MVTVELVLRKRSGNRRYLCRGSVRLTGKGSRQSTGNPAPGFAVIRDPHHHEQTAEICESKPKCPIFVTLSGYLRTRKLCHHNRYLEHQRPDPYGVPIIIKQKLAGLLIIEFDKIERGQITRCVIKKHIF